MKVAPMELRGLEPGLKTVEKMDGKDDKQERHLRRTDVPPTRYRESKEDNQ
jgi:hypothetical protein